MGLRAAATSVQNLTPFPQAQHLVVCGILRSALVHRADHPEAGLVVRDRRVNIKFRKGHFAITHHMCSPVVRPLA